MANFESGVKRYIKAYAVVEVNFPVDWKDNPEVACKHCDYFHSTTRKCGLNHHVVNYPEKHVGDKCPLIPAEETESDFINV